MLCTATTRYVKYNVARAHTTIQMNEEKKTTTTTDTSCMKVHTYSVNANVSQNG